MKSLNQNQKNKVQEFRNVTGASEQQAIELLNKTNYDVNSAVNKFYELGYTGTGQKQGTGAFDKKLETLFVQYATKDTQKIEIDGIVKFFEDLGVDIMDPVTLVISYHLNAKKSGEYAKEEFCGGLQRLNATSIADLKKKIPQLKAELSTDEGFKNVYKFAFNFSKENATQKCLEFESAKALWSLLLPYKFAHHDEWLRFLDKLPKEKQKDVNSDLWNMLLEFHLQTRGDLKKYDPYSAWPTLIDDFMQFMGYQPQEQEY
ncbi:hypothetical protein ABPG74_018210 [Tetrahymena malaccensis]